MKTIFLNVIFFLSIHTFLLGQVAINFDDSRADSSAILDVKSSTKGMLAPRMTLANRDAIVNPAQGLMIYQIDNNLGFYQYNGSVWTKVGDGGAKKINELYDGKSDGRSLYLGSSSGNADDGSNYCVAIGINAMRYNTSGQYNTSVGYLSLKTNTTGSSNTALGMNTLRDASNGNNNTAVGFNAMGIKTTGNYNVALGSQALYRNNHNYNIAIGSNALYQSQGDNNTVIGHLAGENLQDGNNNTFVGYHSGRGNWSHHPGSGNVFIGAYAGIDETGSNKLYIENTSTNTPLIYGEFDNNILRINGTLDINNAYQFPVTDGAARQLLMTDGAGALSWNTNSISNLSDAIVDGLQLSMFLGTNAGVNDDLTGNGNIGIGYEALNSVVSTDDNVAVGIRSLKNNEAGNHNAAVGNYSFYNNLSGESNAGFGFGTGYHNTTGSHNTLIGRDALLNNQTGNNNTIVGFEAGKGSSLHDQSGCVFLGFQAGYNETNDNRLYIGNSDTTRPLIYGEFDNELITVNGNLGLGTRLFGNGSKILSLTHGVPPNIPITDGIMLYCEDVYSSSELKVCDEAGNVTTLSPHNFSLTPKSEPMAWSFYSENRQEGKKINVDMLRSIRLIEKLTGEHLVYIENMDDGSDIENSYEKSNGIIEKQQAQIESLQMMIRQLSERIKVLEGK